MTRQSYKQYHLTFGQYVNFQNTLALLMLNFTYPGRKREQENEVWNGQCHAWGYTVELGLRPGLLSLSPVLCPLSGFQSDVPPLHHSWRVERPYSFTHARVSMPLETLTSPAGKWCGCGPQQCLVGRQLILNRTDCDLGHSLFMTLCFPFLP